MILFFILGIITTICVEFILLFISACIGILSSNKKEGLKNGSDENI